MNTLNSLSKQSGAKQIQAPRRKGGDDGSEIEKEGACGMTAQERLNLISEIYDYLGSTNRVEYHGNYAHRAFRMVPKRWNPNRNSAFAWDGYQIFGAIAGNYRIELSPYYKGLQRIRRNKALWRKVSNFVVLKTGYACLPHDPGKNGQRWRQMYGRVAVTKSSNKKEAV